MADYRPIGLLRTRSYPGYQFMARLRYDGQTPRECLRYTVLCYLDWLRQKLGTDELPQELNTPPAREFLNTEDSVLKSYHFSGGFVLDITSLPEKGMWAARIREPDSERDGKKAQLGRFFVTETALRIDGEDVVLGVRIDVIDPVNAPQQVAAAYRPAFLRTLFANNRLRLRQVGLLNYARAHTVPYYRALRQLMALVESPDRYMPVIVLTYGVRQVNLQQLMSRLDEKLGLTDLPDSFLNRLNGLDLFPETLQLGQPTLHWDADYMCLHSFGYAHVYVVEDDMFALFRERLQMEELRPGDMLWLEPARYGGARRLIRCGLGDGAEKLERCRDDILRDAHCYSKKKIVSWQPLLFEQQLRRLQVQERIHRRLAQLRSGDEEQQKLQAEALEQETQALLQLYLDDNRKAEGRIAQLNDALLQAEIDKETMQEELRELKQQLNSVPAPVLRPRPSDGLCLNAPDISEYYADEVHDLVLCILRQARNSYCGDGTRSAQLLDAILSGNELTGEGKRLFDRLKRVLSGCQNINESISSDLRQLGFEVTKRPNGHYKLIFLGDERYTFTLPGSGSDVRGMKNAFSDIDRQLSVYK